MTQVLVLGAHGMLGSMVARALAQDPALQVTATGRNDDAPAPPGCEYRTFDASADPLGPVLDGGDYEWIMNAIGVIKPRIDERQAASIENAIAINALFPYRLAAESAHRGQRVIQIATDCVYSGSTGAYREPAPHDPVDVYGKSKSLGEVPADSMIHLRCSIIGPELGRSSSLLGWILSAAPGAQLNGFTDHFWNGVTTLHFAKLCAAVIAGTEVPARQHIVPGDSVSKAQLLEQVLSAYGRTDVTVNPGPAPQPIDRTLASDDPDSSRRLWSAAGYDQPPTIAQMLDELAAYEAEYMSEAA
ncbi:MAG TPA: SDR family oxidoreductase [Solirubrobacteraceae bacterium]